MTGCVVDEHGIRGTASSRLTCTRTTAMALQDGEGFLRDYEAVGGKGVDTVVEFADEIRRSRWAKSDHFGTPSESCAVPKGVLAVMRCRRTANPLGFGGATRHCDVEASNCLLVDGSNGMAPRILWPDWRSPVRRNWNPASSVCPIRRGHR